MNRGTSLPSFRNSSVIIIMLSVFLANCQPATVKPVRFDNKRTHALDSFIDSIRTLYNLPGIAYAIIHNDSVYSNAIGIKDGIGHPLTRSTPILAGAVSEPVLAYALLHLAQSGKLNLDDKVVEHLPYFKTGGKAYQRISVRNLLTHTSGIDSYNIFYDKPSFDPNAAEITTRSIGNQVPKWEYPEIQVLRSPYNYDILADLINKVTGEPFEDYIRNNIFRPLGMGSSYFYKVKQTAMPFQISNYLDYSYEQAKTYPYNRENGGSRGLHASIQDFSSWMFHILNHQVSWMDYPKENFFKTEYRTSKVSGIGLGWDIYTHKGIDTYVKSSEFGGFSNQIVLIPSKKIGILILTNINGDFNPSQITSLLRTWLNNQANLKFKTPIHLSMAKKLKATGKASSAVKEFHELKKQNLEAYDFSERSILQLAGNVLYHEKKPRQAIEIFRLCSQEYPSSSETYLGLAEAYLLNKDLKNCQLNIEKAENLPDSYSNKKDFIRYLKERMEIIEEKTTYAK